MIDSGKPDKRVDMDSILVILCYWPLMRTIRVTFFVLVSTLMVIAMLAFAVNGDVKLVVKFLICISIVTWFLIETVAARLAYRHISGLYFDLYHEQDLDDHVEPTDFIYIDEDDDYDGTWGLNLSSEDFYDQDE